MKHSSEFIIAELQHICTKFPVLSVEYAYECSTLYHVVEIEPMEELENNYTFVEWELDFTERFEKEFEGENLLISEKSILNDMSNSLFSNTGNSCEKMFLIGISNTDSFYGDCYVDSGKDYTDIQPVDSWAVNLLNCA